jgi:hypothetical protein
MKTDRDLQYELTRGGRIMTKEQGNQTHPPLTTEPALAVPWGSEAVKTVPGTKTLPYQPGVEQGRVDVTGIVPDGVRIDPDLTEGHPGYEESGESEIIPPERLAGGGGGTEQGNKAD